MIDWNRWLPGLGQSEPEEDDAVTKTLRALGQGVSDAGAAVSQGVSDAGSAISSGLSSAAQTVSDAYNVPTEQRPPQYRGPSYAQPRLDESAAPSLPSLADVGTGLSQAGSGLADTASSVGHTIATEGIATPIGRGIANAGFAAAGVTPREPEAPRPPLPFDQAVTETIGSLGSNIGAVQQGVAQGGAAGYGQAALGALGAVGDLAPSTTMARQLNEMLPKADVRPYDIDSGQWGESLGEVGVGDVIMTAALVHDAARLGYGVIKAGGRVGSSIANAISEGVPAERFRAWTEGNAQRMAAADARMAAQGSTTAPGVFGLSGIEPRRSEVQGMRPRIIPEDVADQLDFPVKPPTDPAVIRAIEAAGGSVDERGTTLHVIRNQGPEAAGGTATRGMTYHIAGEPGAPNPFASEGGDIGGTVRVEGPTRFRNPLFISQESGGKGFLDDALEQLGVQSPPDPARIAREEARVTDLTAAVAESRRTGDRYSIQANEDDLRVAQRHLEQAQQPRPVAGRREIDEQVNRIQDTTPQGSPERVAALQELVERYGGDPSVIPDLVRLRPSRTESGYAIVENVIAAAARRNQHDGVIYLGKGTPDFGAVNAHPAVVAANRALNEANAAESAARGPYDRWLARMRAYGDGPRDASDPHWVTLQEAARAEGRRSPTEAEFVAENDYARAQQRTRDAMEEVRTAERAAHAELTPRTIEELADPREARNPTPGGTDQARIDEIRARGREAVRQVNGADGRYFQRYYDPTATEAEKAALVADREAAQAALHAINDEMNEALNAAPLPPGYTLRPDIPRRAPSEPTTAQASAGALPAAAARSDPLAAVNRVLSQGALSGVTGTTTGLVNQELNPDDPHAFGKGFVAGAAGPVLAQRGARALARASGAEARGARGALGMLGGLPEDVPPSTLGPVAQRVMDTYTALTPKRVEAVTAKGIDVATAAIEKRARPGAMPVPAAELVPQIHAAVVRNLEDTKVVMTGLNYGALRAFLRGEGLTSKAETGSLDLINQITTTQVNVAGGRQVLDEATGTMKKAPFTIKEGADFAQRESEQMRAVTGGSRFPDPETGAIDTEAPKVLYAYVSEGQPLVAPNRPTLGLVWKPETPRVSSVNHPFGLLSPNLDMHKAMAEGSQDLVYAADAVRGGRIAPATMEGGRLVEAAAGVPSSGKARFGWEQGGIDIGGGRKLVDTDYLVGPEGESSLRATSLVSGMSKDIQEAIARGQMTDPEQIAAVLMRGGSPQWKPGWGSVMNPTRTESLVLDPHLANVQAIYISGTPSNLASMLEGGKTGGVGGGKGERLAELEMARRMRAAIKEQTGNDVPIIFNDTTRAAASKKMLEEGASNEGWAPRLISDAQVLEGPPLTLSPGRGRIVDQYTQATDPTTGRPYMNIGVSAGAVPPAAGRGVYPERGTSRGDPLASVNRALSQGVVSTVSGGVGAQVNQEMNPDDPYAGLKGFAAGALVPPLAQRGARGLARLAGARGAEEAGGALATAGGLPGDGGAARRARLAANRATANPTQIANLAGQAAATPMTGPHTNGQHVTRNVAQQIQKQAAGGVPPQVPTGPMPPPDPPPSWWDHMESWRYNLGLFAQLSTGMVQAAGGVIQAAGGGAAEALRLGVLKGQPEALLPIAGEALRSIPGGIKSAALTAAGQVPKAIQAGSDYKPPVHAREFAQGNIGRGSASWAVGLPGRVMTQAPDALWHEMFYKTGIAQAAADEARRQAGGSPLAMADRLRIQRDLIANPTPEILDAATQLAQNATYKGEPGRVLGAPKKMTEALGPVGSFFMPIYNTIARIHEQALEYTPGVGMLPLEKVGLAPKNQARPVSRRIAQQAVGGSLVLGGLSYAAEGGIRGPGPSNSNEAQAMRDQGYTPNTTNVGGYWIPNTWFGPWGPILNEIGAINDARLYDHGDKGWDDLTWEKKAAAIITMSGRAAADYPALDTAQTITKLFTAPEDALPSFLGEVAAQYVPGPLRTKAMAEDPMARTRTRGPDVPFEQRFWETVKQRSGYARQELPAAQDILGREVANPRQGWGRALAPNIREEKPDPIIQAFLDHDLNIGDPPTALSVGALKPGLGAPELSPEETRRWNTIRGEQIIKSVGDLMASDAWATHDAAWRTSALESRRAAAGEYATGTLRKEIGETEVRRRMTERGSRKAAS